MQHVSINLLYLFNNLNAILILNNNKIFKDNTNNFEIELYDFYIEMNDIGFPLAYLFLENNGKCREGIRTKIIQTFLTKLHNMGIHPEFILIDKDFVQINITRFTWKGIKVQLCK